MQQVAQGSPAQEAGIEPGDIIYSLNRKPVKDVRQFIDMVSKFKGGDVLQMLLDRHGSTIFVVLSLPKEPKE